MHSRQVAMGILAVAISACTTAAGPSPSVERSIAASLPPSSLATQPTAGAKPLELEVTWDGTQCAYRGPMVIPDRTLTRFTYTVPGEIGPLLFVGGVTPGTTWQTIVAYVGSHRASEVPDWLVRTGTTSVYENSSAIFTVSRRAGGDGPEVGGYFVGCATAPAEDGGTDVMYPAALLEIVEP